MLIGAYDIFLDERKVGQAKITHSGLYYTFFCTCNCEDGKIYRLQINCGKGWEPLGIPIPERNGYILSKKVPCKQFSGATPSFRLILKEDGSEKRFVPVLETEPFAFLSQLQTAMMEIRNGVQGILLAESI